jgi:hypothetical protein
MTLATIWTICKAIVKGRRNLAKADKATDEYRDTLKAKIIERGSSASTTNQVSKPTTLVDSPCTENK